MCPGLGSKEGDHRVWTRARGGYVLHFGLSPRVKADGMSR